MDEHAVYGPCDDERFELRPGQTVVRAFDPERSEVHVYELDDGALLYQGARPEIEYLRARVAELEGQAA